jgi:phage shock protein A
VPGGVQSGGLSRRLGLIERVVGMRREADTGDPRSGPPASEAPDRLERLEERIEHLEAALEGLQDSVHRESVRLGEAVADLRERTDPHVVAQALSADARKRGV